MVYIGLTHQAGITKLCDERIKQFVRIAFEKDSFIPVQFPRYKANAAFGQPQFFGQQLCKCCIGLALFRDSCDGNPEPGHSFFVTFQPFDCVAPGIRV